MVTPKEAPGKFAGEMAVEKFKGRREKLVFIEVGTLLEGATRLEDVVTEKETRDGVVVDTTAAAVVTTTEAKEVDAEVFTGEGVARVKVVDGEVSGALPLVSIFFSFLLLLLESRECGV